MNLSLLTFYQKISTIFRPRVEHLKLVQVLQEGEGSREDVMAYPECAPGSWRTNGRNSTLPGIFRQKYTAKKIIGHFEFVVFVFLALKEIFRLS